MLGKVCFPFILPLNGVDTINFELVVTFYSKEAGGGSRHAWQATTSAITALSYLVVQTFEKSTPMHFRAVHRNKANIRANTFLHIPSTQFLCRLQEAVVFDNPQTIMIQEKDWTTFQKISKCSAALALAIKDLNGTMRGGKKG